MIFNCIPVPPLPVLFLLLPLFCSVLILGFEGIRYIFKISHRKPIELGKRALKIIFLAVVLIEAVFSILLWFRFQNVEFASYVLSGTGWTMTLSGGSGSVIQSNITIDIISSTSAAISSFVALIACLLAITDKENILTAKKIAFFFLTLCGIQGVFFSGSLFTFFVFFAIAQIGASGLLRPILHERAELWRTIGYFASRFLLLLMLFAGNVMFAVKYDVYSFSAISAVIQPGNVEKTAFALIAAPLLYLFVKPPIYTTDPANRCCFAICAQAAFFAFFRSVFIMTGVMSGFERIPMLIEAIGVLVVFTSLTFAANEREPIRFVSALESSLKGFMLIALGICLSGVYSAAAVADYGYVALEAQISLMLIFLPSSAALSVAAAHLRQEANGSKLWLTGGHITELSYTGLLFALAVCMISGLPPAPGFAAHQFLYRSANAVSPFLTLILFSASIFILFTGLRYIMMILFGRRSTDTGVFKGDSAITLPLIMLLLMITTATVMPGRIYEKIVSPSVKFMVSRIRHVGAEQSAEKVENTGDTSSGEGGAGR